MGTQSYNAAVDMVDRHVAQGRGGKVAFIDPARQLTYGELAESAARVGPMLGTLGLKREDRVAMMVLDTVDFPILFWGAIRAGIIPVPLNTLLTAEQYRYILEDMRAKVLFVSAPLLSVAQQAAAGLDLAVVVIGETNELPRFDKLLAAETKAADAVATSADEVAFWLYSSGSTGMPKGVRHVHTSAMETAKLYAQGVMGIREDDVVYSAAKLFFAYGLGNAMSFPMSVGATAVLLPERPTPQSVFAVLKREQPTIFYGVPTLYAAMLADPACTPENSSQRLRMCVSAGEGLPEHLGTEWKKRFGVDIYDGVGSTEMLHIFLGNYPGKIKYGTSGVPIPGYEARLIDDNGREVAEGEIGELSVRGTTAADGYWNQREKSRRTFEGEWTRTGDKYTRGADGFYRICGRTDDMFKVSGQWVSPFEVESALITHPRVLECAIVPKEDADGLLKPKAFIVLKGEGGRPGEAELQEHVKQQVGPWKYPRWIEFVDGLPKTATGKIQRFKLRD
jgi:4-hydroxybenzoate-CoA ligase